MRQTYNIVTSVGLQPSALRCERGDPQPGEGGEAPQGGELRGEVRQPWATDRRGRYSLPRGAGTIAPSSTVLLYHGLRREELSTLKVRDIHPRRGVLHLRVHGKGGKVRYLPLHPG